VENMIQETQKQLDEVRKLLEDEPQTTTQQVDPGTSPEAVALEAQIAQLEAELTALLARFTESFPDVRQKRGELDAAKAKLQELRRTDGNAAKREIQVDNPRHQELTTKVSGIVDDPRTLQFELSAMKKERERLVKLVEGFTPEAHEYSELLRNRETLATKYGQYQSMVEQTQWRAYAEKERQGTVVKVFSSALLPKQPSFPPGPLVVLVIALGVGLGVGTGFVVLGEMADHSFRTVEDASDFLDFPILGSIGTISVAVSPTAVWAKRILVVLMVAGLGCAITLSYIFQDQLRSLLKSLLS